MSLGSSDAAVIEHVSEFCSDNILGHGRDAPLSKVAPQHHSENEENNPDDAKSNREEPVGNERIDPSIVGGPFSIPDLNRVTDGVGSGALGHSTLEDVGLAIGGLKLDDRSEPIIFTRWSLRPQIDDLAGPTDRL